MALGRRAFVWSLGIAPLAGQKPAAIYVTVRDRNSQFVRNLTADDFTIEVDRRPRPALRASHASEGPSTIGVLLDCSPNQQAVLEQHRDAAARFLGRVIRSDRDQGFVLRFEAESELVCDVTKSVAAIESAIRRIRPEAGPQFQQRVPGAAKEKKRSGTALYDAVLLAADEVLKRESDRKIVVLVSEGADTASRTKIGEAIEAAQRAGVIVHAIRAFDPSYKAEEGRVRFVGEAPDGRKVLPRIARETGGGYWEVTRKVSIEDAFVQALEAVNSQYRIEFDPGRGGPDGYRSLAVSMRNKMFGVAAPTGFFHQ